MTSHDTLVLIAELAVAIAGFSGVVVAVEPRGVRAWEAAKRFNLRVLLQVSALTIFFSLFPLVLERAVAQPDSWRWALWTYGVVHLVDVSSFMLRSPPEAVTTHRLAQRIGFVAACASLVVAGFGSLLLMEIYYLAMLVWHLGVAAMGFAFLILGDPSEGAA